MIYYRTPVNDGIVTNPENLVRLCIDPDFDCDGDVELDDYAVFAACLGGPDVTTPLPGCTPTEFDWADLEGDNDVDLYDLRYFCEMFSP